MGGARNYDEQRLRDLARKCESAMELASNQTALNVAQITEITTAAAALSRGLIHARFLAVTDTSLPRVAALRVALQVLAQELRGRLNEARRLNQ